MVVRGSYQAVISSSSECYTTMWKMKINNETPYCTLLSWSVLPTLTFCLIVRGFHRTLATDESYQERKLSPPDAWSCPTLGLECSLMSRPISPLLVLTFEFLRSLVNSILRSFYAS